ncbi:MAG: phosphatase PAP2 family protein [Firmicutes bacterium]|nr:phosphatase PAP2 family protein [Bacillota bacterium]
MNSEHKPLVMAILLLVFFAVFTFLVKTVDVQAIGPEGSSVGFASLNGALAKGGYRELWYKLSKYTGCLALAVIGVYGCLGLMQLIKRKDLKKVDRDIIVLGCFYLVVGILYVLFNKLVINYRPVILEEGLEPSYPSSHTMLGLCVFLSAVRMESIAPKGGSSLYKKVLAGLAVFLLLTRLFSGVHWFTDILGGALLSAALLCFFGWALDRFGGSEKNIQK